MMRLPAATLTVVVLVLGPALASCSGTSTSSDNGSSAASGSAGASSGASASPVVCADLKDLKASMAALKDIKIGQGGLADLGTTLTTMQAQVQKLAQDAKSEFSPETSAVRSNAKALQRSLKQATTNPSLDSFAAVKNDLSALGTSFDALTSAVGNAC